MLDKLNFNRDERPFLSHPDSHVGCPTPGPYDLLCIIRSSRIIIPEPEPTATDHESSNESD